MITPNRRTPSTVAPTIHGRRIRRSRDAAGEAAGSGVGTGAGFRASGFRIPGPPRVGRRAEMRRKSIVKPARLVAAVLTPIGEENAGHVHGPGAGGIPRFRSAAGLRRSPDRAGSVLDRPRGVQSLPDS